MPEGFMLNRFCLNNDCCKFGNKVKITSDVVTYFQVHKRINRFGIIWGKEYQYLSMWNFNQTCETAMHALGPLPSFYRVSSKCRGDCRRKRSLAQPVPRSSFHSSAKGHDSLTAQMKCTRLSPLKVHFSLRKGIARHEPAKSNLIAASPLFGQVFHDLTARGICWVRVRRHPCKPRSS